MNYIIRSIRNGGDGVDLATLTIDPSKVDRVWTIINEKLLMGDSTNLQEAKPKHWKSTFLEDKMHDWTVRDGKLFFHGHSTERGAEIDLFVQTKD